MKVFAVVPVKGLDTSKIRLSSIFSLEERKALTVAMLEDVLKALKSSKIHNIIVTSPDSAVRAIADRYAVWYISSSQTGLNPSLNEAIESCIHENADSVLIFPADLPLIRWKEIDKLVDLGSKEKTLVLSPSFDGGTNALLMNPPNLIRVSFGPDSFFEHVKASIHKGVTLKFYASRTLALDIDTAEDLNKLVETEKKTITHRVMKRIISTREKKL